MATTDQPLLNETGESDSSPPLDLDVRKSRLSLWCIIFWIVALASLTANSLADQTSDDQKTVERLYLSGDCMFLVGILLTIVHLYVVTGNEICKLIGGGLFIVGGILHIAATSKFVDYFCVDRFDIKYLYGNLSWCRAQHFASDFMAEYLSIFIGIDIITFYFDKRILRLIGYCCILSVCCLMMCSFLKHEANLFSTVDTDSNHTNQSAYFITGIVSGVVFIVLLVIQIGNRNVQHNETTRYVHLFLGFALVNGAGLIFYSMIPEYQTLLVIATAVIIAYELQYM